jgi:hypothetical protein
VRPDEVVQQDLRTLEWMQFADFNAPDGRPTWWHRHRHSAPVPESWRTQGRISRRLWWDAAHPTESYPHKWVQEDRRRAEMDAAEDRRVAPGEGIGAAQTVHVPGNDNATSEPEDRVPPLTVASAPGRPTGSIEDKSTRPNDAIGSPDHHHAGDPVPINVGGTAAKKSTV